MVLDKSSIKELYDNRDIIAQLGCLRNDMDNLPRGEYLTRLWEYMVLFLNRYEYLMFEDKSAYIDAQHVFIVPPVYHEKAPDFDHLDNKAFVSKEMLSGSFASQYFHKTDGKLQTVFNEAEFKNSVKYKGYSLENTFLIKNQPGLTQEVHGTTKFYGVLQYNGTDLDTKYLNLKGKNVQMVDGEVQVGEKIVGKKLEVEEDIKANVGYIEREFEAGLVNIRDKLTTLVAEIFNQVKAGNVQSELASQRNDDVMQVAGSALFEGDIYNVGDIQTNVLSCEHIIAKTRGYVEGDYHDLPLVDNSFITYYDLKKYSPEIPTDKFFIKTWDNDQICVGSHLDFNVDFFDIQTSNPHGKINIRNNLDIVGETTFVSRPIVTDRSKPLEDNMLVTWGDISPRGGDIIVPPDKKIIFMPSSGETTTNEITMFRSPLAEYKQDRLIIKDTGQKSYSGDLKYEWDSKIIYGMQNKTNTGASFLFDFFRAFTSPAGRTETIATYLFEDKRFILEIGHPNDVFIKAVFGHTGDGYGIQFNKTPVIVNEQGNTSLVTQKYIDENVVKQKTTYTNENNTETEECEIPLMLLGKPFTLVLGRNKTGNQYRDVIYIKNGKEELTVIAQHEWRE